MPQRRRISIPIAALLAAGLLGIFLSLGIPCGGDGNAERSTTANIGAAGGLVDHEGARLEIPAGALPADTTITITTTEESGPPGVSAYTPVFHFEPDGLTFAQPVTLTLDLGEHSGSAVLFWWGDDKNNYEVIRGQTEQQQLIASIVHFSNGGGGTMCDHPELCRSGCCDDGLGCIVGDQDHRCGKAGAKCGACAVGEVCVVDTCRQPNANTCSHGCVDSTIPGFPRCMRGNEPGFCGSGGEQCKSCPGTECRNQSCLECIPGNCDGCCTKEGVCLSPPKPGDLPGDPGGGPDYGDHNCGGAASLCLDCDKVSPGWICDDGICAPRQPCDATTCPDGCCSEGVCFDIDIDSKCGRGGVECAECPVGKLCFEQECKDCGPGTCKGCCTTYSNGSVSCESYRDGDNFNCGANGAECKDCRDEGKICSEGKCEPCSPSSCKDGCCGKDYNDHPFCWVGKADHCGTAGGACTRCDLPEADKCDDGKCMCVGGECVLCGPDTCDGCCQDGAGGVYCFPAPGQDTACGKDGDLCQDCTKSQKLCDEGVCDVCGPGNCDGCCTLFAGVPMCVTGASASACGKNGEACDNCDPYFCVEGDCRPNAGTTGGDTGGTTGVTSGGTAGATTGGTTGETTGGTTAGTTSTTPEAGTSPL